MWGMTLATRGPIQCNAIYYFDEPRLKGLVDEHVAVKYSAVQYCLICRTVQYSAIHSTKDLDEPRLQGLVDEHVISKELECVPLVRDGIGDSQQRSQHHLLKGIGGSDITHR